MYVAVNKNNPQEVHSFKWTGGGILFINDKVVDKDDWNIIEVEPVNRLWNYSLSTNTVWTSFDHGQVQATSYDEAIELATAKLKYDLQKANEILASCDPTLGFVIDMDFKDLCVDEEIIVK